MLIDADIAADLVEIDVAGLGYRVVQIDLAVTFRSPVAITVRAAGQSCTSPMHMVRRVRFVAPVFKCRERQHRLDCRARRITAADRAVEQRPIHRSFCKCVVFSWGSCRWQTEFGSNDGAL